MLSFRSGAANRYPSGHIRQIKRKAHRPTIQLLGVIRLCRPGACLAIFWDRYRRVWCAGITVGGHSHQLGCLIAPVSAKLMALAPADTVKSRLCSFIGGDVFRLKAQVRLGHGLGTTCGQRHKLGVLWRCFSACCGDWLLLASSPAPTISHGLARGHR